MNNTNTVSIIIPMFNAEKYVDRCLLSLLNQTYKDLEILVIDDNSTDNSVEIVKAFQERDSRIVLLKNSAKGVSAARNLGIKIAKGKWLMFCDVDDWMENDAVNTFVSHASEKNVDLVIGGYVRDYYQNDILEYTSKTGISVMLSGGAESFTIDFLYTFRCGHVLVQSPWAKLYKSSIVRELMLKFNEAMICYEDFEFNLKYMMQVKQYCFLNCQSYHYIKSIGENSILKRKKDDLVDEIYAVYNALNKLFDKYKNDSFEDEMRRWLLEAYRVPIIKLMSLNNKKDKIIVLNHLANNEGFIDISSLSRAYRIIRKLIKIKQYSMVLFLVKHHFL